MSDTDDYEKLLRATRRRGWEVPTVAAILSVVGSAVATAWTVRGYLDAVERLLSGQEIEIRELRGRIERLEPVRDLAMSAKTKADITEAKLDGHLRPDPEVKRR